MWRNTDHSWGTPAKLLHWSIAALVFVQIALGWAAVNWRLSPMKLDLFVWHKSTGLLILALMVVRVAWRVVNVAPSLPADIPSLECRLARASHLLLYLLLFLMPITGWVVHSAANIPFRMFWLIPVPAIVAPDKAMSDLAARAHYAIFIVLAALLAVHIGAALRHHYRKRNQVFVRMLPGG